MNKKIIPAEASFFVPVEKVLFDHSRMRRSLETATAENYPALTEDIMWDYTLFTFEKKTGNTRGVKGWIEHAELTPDGENYFKNGVDE